MLDSIATIYDVKRGNGEIRRVNVNVAPLTVDEFKELKASGIGTYQLFQETYHRDTYSAVHVGGKKRDYDWRVTGMHRAMEAGIDDVGIGVLFGLFDWRFEMLAMLQHIRHLERAYGVGPHTISVPRLEPAGGSDMASHPPQPVSDVDFRKIVAILRLAVPVHRHDHEHARDRQHPPRDLRPGRLPDQRRQPHQPRRLRRGRGVRRGPVPARRPPLAGRGHPRRRRARVTSPRFCTACYRLGRTGMDFMDLAKPGDIKHHCDPNALSTFQEYLLDYGSAETRGGRRGS